MLVKDIMAAEEELQRAGEDTAQAAGAKAIEDGRGIVLSRPAAHKDVGGWHQRKLAHT